jgi:hypothetical protein
VAVDWCGAKVFFTELASGNACTPIQSEADGNLRNGRNHAHPMENGEFYGPGVAVTTVAAFVIRDASAPNIISGGCLKNMTCYNFASDVVFGSGAFMWEFYHCNFTITGGTPTTYSITVPSESNNGERNRFIGCTWNNRDLVLDQSNANANTFFEGCSLDYGKRTFTVSAGAAYVIGGHVEQLDDTDNAFRVSGANSLIFFGGVDFVWQAAKANFSPFYSDSTCTNGGVIILGGRWNQVGGFTVPLVGGTGRSNVQDLVFQSGASKPAISAAQNVFAYGGFESANWTAEWTTSGTPPPTRTTAQARTGSYSLQFPATPTNTPAATRTIEVKPQQFVTGELYYKTANFTGSGATFYVTVSWLDAAGNQISGQDNILATTTVSSWARVPLAINTPAPAGAASFKIAVGIFGATSGTPTAYIDDVILTAE